LTPCLHSFIGNALPALLSPFPGNSRNKQTGLLEGPVRRDHIDLKTLLTTFGLIFLAELGDKTRFAALSLSAESESRLSVFLGASPALASSALIAVRLGAVLAGCFPPHVIKTVGGLLFVAMGAVMLISR